MPCRWFWPYWGVAMRGVPLEQFRVVGPLYMDESGCILRKLALDEYAKLNRVSED
jgi:hypothetical protein